LAGPGRAPARAAARADAPPGMRYMVKSGNFKEHVWMSTSRRSQHVGRGGAADCIAIASQPGVDAQAAMQSPMDMCLTIGFVALLTVLPPAYSCEVE